MLLLRFIIIVLLVGCGGSDSSTIGDAGGEIEVQTQIVFPIDGLTNSSETVVRGTTVGSELSLVTEVTVNGVAADSQDSFASWTAVVPLDQGENPLTVTVNQRVQSEGNATVFYYPTVLSQPFRSARYGNSDKVLILNHSDSNNDLVSIDLVSRHRRIISASNVGSGPMFSQTQGLVYEDPDSALVVSRAQPAVIRVDLTTGNRTVVSDQSTGTGPALTRVTGIALLDNNTALVTVGEINDISLLRVDLATGNRTIVSGLSRGSGPVPSNGSDPVIETATSVLLTDFDALGDAVLRVDLATGNRTVVSGPSRGSGPLFHFDRIILEDSVSVLGTTRQDFVVRIDLATGNRTIVSDGSNAEQGPKFDSGIELLLAQPNAVLLISGALDYITRVDLQNGQRSVVGDANRGTGYPLRKVDEDIVRENDTHFLVFDRHYRAVIRVDSHTGDRVVLSDDNIGSGPSFETFGQLVLRNSRFAIFLGDSNDQILSIDLLTGDRSLIASVSDARGMVLENEDSLLVMARVNPTVFFRVDLNTGDVNSVRAASGCIMSPVLTGLAEVVYIDECDRVLRRFNLSNGDVTLIADDVRSKLLQQLSGDTEHVYYSIVTGSSVLRDISCVLDCQME